MEHHALQLAFHAGVRVPQPYLLYENALLMELIVDVEGRPAPRMSDRGFEAEQAVALYKDAFEQIRLLLTLHRVHGDLSPYNILMGAKEADDHRACRKRSTRRPTCAPRSSSSATCAT